MDLGQACPFLGGHNWDFLSPGNKGQLMAWSCSQAAVVWKPELEEKPEAQP